MSKLAVYNAALRLIKESQLASLTEEREARRELDAVWDGEPSATDYLLSQGLWNFAMRASKLTPSSEVSSGFGKRYVYEKPADFIRLNKLCIDEYLRIPTLEYDEEGGMWLSDFPELFIQYVSNDKAYGGNLALWPATFVKFAGAYLASEVAGSLTQDENIVNKALGYMAGYRQDAKSKDSMEQAPQKIPEGGTFIRARQGGKFSGNSGGGIF